MTKYIGAVVVLVVIIVVMIIIYVLLPKQFFGNGSSHRLGNKIVAWYFGSLGVKDNEHKFSNYEKGTGLGNQPPGTLGSWLKIDKSRVQRDYSQQTRNRILSSIDGTWGISQYKIIAEVTPFMRPLLREQLFSFAKAKRPELLTHLTIPYYDLVVHYRVGDFISLGYTVSLENVLKSCRELISENSFTKGRIAVMDGGLNHIANVITVHKGRRIIQNLVNKLKQFCKNVDIVSNDTDTDFFICAGAPNLVTAAGSFAICAAIACNGNIRTPACANILTCKVSKNVSERWVTNKWKTYSII